MTPQTMFTKDALGRFLCSTWEEATGNGGRPFDVIVLGAGMYGAYLAAELDRQQPAKRVLVLDAGSFLVPEHVQNISSVASLLTVPRAMNPDWDNGAPRDQVWGIAWRGNVDFPGMAYCAGGRSLYWGGWCPTPDLADWPWAIRHSLHAHLDAVSEDIGVTETTDFLDGPFQDGLVQLMKNAGAGVPTLAAGEVGPAPLAVQGRPPASGVFGFDKFSSVPPLMAAVDRDRRAARNTDAYRRLFVVPQAHVIDVVRAGRRVTALDVAVGGRWHRLAVAPHGKVVLAMGTIESTRVALNSFRSPLMGRNLMAHLRSNFTLRVRRSLLGGAPADEPETAAALFTAARPRGRFHLQITASNSTAGPDDLLFRSVPDLGATVALHKNVDPDWIGLNIRVVGQMHGTPEVDVGDPGTSWIDVRADRPDEFGVPRAYVHMAVRKQDQKTWRHMDAAVAGLAAGLGDVRYRYGDKWHRKPWRLDRPYPEWHDGLGTTHHEAGTLWMGDDAATSVTDPSGKFHHLDNAYACDQSVFPVVGSANPVLTGLALARRLAGLL
jgi:choline dehydrogenase-like flavoprotein